MADTELTGKKNNGKVPDNVLQELPDFFEEHEDASNAPNTGAEIYIPAVRMDQRNLLRKMSKEDLEALMVEDGTVKEVTSSDGTVDVTTNHYNYDLSIQQTITDFQGQIDDANDRIERVENLGDYVGSFDTLANLPTNINAFDKLITVNDFATVQADEDHNGVPARYVVIEVNGPDITWQFDLTYSRQAYCDDDTVVITPSDDNPITKTKFSIMPVKNEIETNARKIDVEDNANGSFTFTDYDGDTKIIPTGKKVQSTDETVVVVENTNDFDLSIQPTITAMNVADNALDNAKANIGTGADAPADSFMTNVLLKNDDVPANTFRTLGSTNVPQMATEAGTSIADITTADDAMDTLQNRLQSIWNKLRTLQASKAKIAGDLSNTAIAPVVKQLNASQLTTINAINDIASSFAGEKTMTHVVQLASANLSTLLEDSSATSENLYGTLITTKRGGNTQPNSVSQLLLVYMRGSTQAEQVYYRSVYNLSPASSKFKRITFIGDNIASATKLATPIQISVTGNITGNITGAPNVNNTSGKFDGSTDITISTTYNAIVPINKGGTGTDTVSNANQVFRNTAAGSAPDFGTLTADSITSGTLPVGRGGTGVTTSAGTINDIKLGNFSNLAPTANAALYWNASNALTKGTLPVASGGTGKTSIAANKMLYATAANTYDEIDANATPNRVLRTGNTGNTKPTWSQVVLTTDVTGTLPVASGGTGLTSAPSMLTNLATNSAASPLAASPRPGVTGTLPVSNGGTGRDTLTSNSLLKGNGTNPIAYAAAGTDYVIPSGSITGNAATATQLANAKNFNVSGDVSGTAQSFDGTANITIPTSYNNVVPLAKGGLEKVLGSYADVGNLAMNREGFPANGNFDDITDNGIYIHFPEVYSTNGPPNMYQWGTLVVTTASVSWGYTCVQTYTGNYGGTWVRNNWNGGAWQPWTRLATLDGDPNQVIMANGSFSTGLVEFLASPLTGIYQDIEQLPDAKGYIAFLSSDKLKGYLFALNCNDFVQCSIYRDDTYSNFIGGNWNSVRSSISSVQSRLNILEANPSELTTLADLNNEAYVARGKSGIFPVRITDVIPGITTTSQTMFGNIIIARRADDTTTRITQFLHIWNLNGSYTNQLWFRASNNSVQLSNINFTRVIDSTMFNGSTLFNDDPLKFVKGNGSLSNGYGEFLSSLNGDYDQISSFPGASGYLVILSSNKLCGMIIANNPCSDGALASIYIERSNVSQKFVAQNFGWKQYAFKEDVDNLVNNTVWPVNKGGTGNTITGNVNQIRLGDYTLLSGANHAIPYWNANGALTKGSAKVVDGTLSTNSYQIVSGNDGSLFKIRRIEALKMGYIFPQAIGFISIASGWNLFTNTNRIETAYRPYSLVRIPLIADNDPTVMFLELETNGDYYTVNNTGSVKEGYYNIISTLYPLA